MATCAATSTARASGCSSAACCSGFSSSVPLLVGIDGRRSARSTGARSAEATKRGARRSRPNRLDDAQVGAAAAIAVLGIAWSIIAAAAALSAVPGDGAALVDLGPALRRRSPSRRGCAPARVYGLYLRFVWYRRLLAGASRLAVGVGCRSAARDRAPSTRSEGHADASVLHGRAADRHLRGGGARLFDHLSGDREAAAVEAWLRVRSSLPASRRSTG